MQDTRSTIALLCAALALTPAGGFAADPPAPQRTSTTQITVDPKPHGILAKIERPYTPRKVGPINTSNTTRIEQLLRAGNLYLSLQDTIALALENNLDIAIQRYNPQIAETNVMLAEAGGAARGVSTTV